jgi:H+-transporting ATPase
MKPDADQPKAPEPEPGASVEPKAAAPASKPGLKADAKSDGKPDPNEDLKTLPLAEVEKKLGSSPDGLTQAKAQKRLTQYGPNELVEKKTNLLLKFLGYFWGPIPWMIEVAVILSGVVRHWPDFFHYSPVAGDQCGRRFLGRTSGGQ